jgi:signal transduction histidine kinase
MDRLRREFIWVVSLELRTSMTSINGSLGLIAGGLGGRLDPQGRNPIGISRRNCERLARLVNDILDIEKPEAGKMVFHRKEPDLADLVRQAIESNRSYAEQAGASLELAGDVSGSKVFGDGDRLTQVLVNLITNACKFSPRGGVVRDRIFQEFLQSDSTDARQKAGTGLGPAITKAIVEKHGGRIGFDSEPGRGATFWFGLDAHPSAMPVPG